LDQGEQGQERKNGVVAYMKVEKPPEKKKDNSSVQQRKRRETKKGQNRDSSTEKTLHWVTKKGHWLGEGRLEEGKRGVGVPYEKGQRVQENTYKSKTDIQKLNKGFKMREWRV